MGMTGALSTQNDEELMLAFSQGNEHAFVILFNRYDQQVMGFLVKRVCYDRALAEDLSQKVWMSLIQGSQSYQTTAKFRTFLFTIVRNRVIDHYRASREHLHVGDLYADDGVEEAEAGHLLTPDQAYEQEQEMQQLEAALLELPEHYRMVLLLFYEQDMTVQEISQALDMPLERTKSRIRYARQALYKLISGEQSLLA